MKVQKRGRLFGLWGGVRAGLAAFAVFALALGIALAAPAPAQAATGHTVTFVTFDPVIGGSWYRKFPDGSYKKTLSVTDGTAINFDSVTFHNNYVPADTSDNNYPFLYWAKVDTKTKTTSIWYTDTPVTEDMTLFAVFGNNAKDCLVKFVCPIDGNADTVVASQYVDAGSRATKPADPDRYGYDLVDWYTDRACTKKFNFNTAINGNTTLYGKFELTKHKVMFDQNTSAVPFQKLVEVTHGETVREPKDWTLTGYDFAGWYIDKDCTTKYDFSTPVMNDITLYAKWTIKKLTVKFETGEGTPVATQTVDYGSYLTKPEDPQWTKDVSKVFGYWYYDGDSSTVAYGFNKPITFNMTLHAEWLDAVTVTLSANGGTFADGSQESIVRIAKGTSLGSFPVVTKAADSTSDAYILDGWLKQDTSEEVKAADKITSDVTLIANWHTGKNYHSVTYYNGEYVVHSDAVEDGTILGADMAPQVSRTGYTFAGWYTDKACTQQYHFGNKVTADLDLYAKWTPETRTVTCNANGGTFADGTASTSETVNYDACAKLSEVPTYEGYDFAGWYTTDDDKGYEFDRDNTSVQENITLYAHWRTKTLQVTFDSQGGSAVDESQTIDYNHSVVRPSDPTRAGYAFDGWYTKDGEKWRFTDDTKPDAVTSDVTLYAKWTEETYTVTFDLNGGTSKKPNDQTVKYGGKLIEPKDPTKENDGFYAWFTADGVKWDFDNSVVTGNMTLHAEWVEGGNDGGNTDAVTYIVCYYVDGEFVGMGFGVTGDAISRPDDDTIASGTLSLSDDQAIDGWYLDADFKTKIDFNTYTMADDNLDIYARVVSKSELTHTVFFVTGIDATVDPVQVKAGEKISAPDVKLTAKGYTFAGWYTDKDCTKKFDFDTAITADTTLWAGWIKNGEVEPTPSPDGKKDSSKKKSIPQTGDNALIAICAAGAAGIAAMVGGIAVRRRKE